MTQILLTARAESTAFALSEWQRFDAMARPVRTLAPGVVLADLPVGWGAYTTAAPSLIFTRHVFPVQFYLAHFADQAALRTALLNAVDLPTEPAPNDRAFSIQARGGIPQSLCHELENTLIARGYEKNTKHPFRVLSLYAHETTLYAGVSLAAHNRSRWNGGAPRYKREGALSRAAFKLLEALEVFGLTVPAPPARTLDLGAAPGGWTKALLEAGAMITAVDPGALDPRIAAHPRLRYVCATAQRFFAAAPADTRFGLIVNDMKMDMHDSIRVMNDAAHLLAPGGAAVVTLKLKAGQGLSKIRKALEQLQKKYRVAGTRQLFHNRDEVTVYLQI